MGNEAKLLEKKNTITLLKQFTFHKKAHKTKSTYQIWEEGFHPKLIQSEAMMLEKLKIIRAISYLDLFEFAS